MTDQANPFSSDEEPVVAERRAKLARIRDMGSAYPNDFSRTQMMHPVSVKFRGVPAEELAQREIALAVAGRLISKRVDGEISYGTLEDVSGRMQIAVSDAASGKAGHAAYALWDPGDIVGVEGILYKTADNELTIRAHSIRLLAKSLRSAFDAGAGLPRYAQLIVDADARRRVTVRARILQAIRHLFSSTQYMEVETPLLQPATGADATDAFETHHNALGMSLYLRASALPYLARLAVGGMEKIYEINRCFRNDERSDAQGLEPTLMEIICAYSGYEYMMALLELVIARAAKSALGATSVPVQEQTVELTAPFARISLAEAIRRHAPAAWSEAQLRDREFLAQRLKEHGVTLDAAAPWGRLQVALFRALVAPRLIEPVFVIDFPVDRSTLARHSPRDAELTESFELVIGGQTIAYGLSLVNDPAELEGRAAEPEFARAVEYGLPPSAGAGLAIDAMTMLLTGSSSPRDAAVFPGPPR